MTPPAVALTIAGSDSGGGAGLQADLATFALMGLHGTCAVTAVTAQDTRGVQAVHLVPSEVVLAQVTAVVGDFAVTAVKTGMLATTSTIRAVGALAAAGRLPRLVVDPVLASSSGQALVDRGGPAAYLEHLLPHATVVTPNLDETEQLLGTAVRTVAQMRAAAAELAALGPAVVVTGGHLIAGETTVDVLHVGGTTFELLGPRVETTNTHGTGCTFSAALAARLGRGDDVQTAAHAAKRHVAAALTAASGWRLGHGAGPLDHLTRTPLTRTLDEENS